MIFTIFHIMSWVDVSLTGLSQPPFCVNDLKCLPFVRFLHFDGIVGKHKVNIFFKTYLQFFYFFFCIIMYWVHFFIINQFSGVIGEPKELSLAYKFKFYHRRDDKRNPTYTEVEKLYSTLYNVLPKAVLFTGFPTCKTTIKCTDSAEFAGEKDKSKTIFI